MKWGALGPWAWRLFLTYDIYSELFYKLWYVCLVKILKFWSHAQKTTAFQKSFYRALDNTGTFSQILLKNQSQIPLSLKYLKFVFIHNLYYMVMNKPMEEIDN